MLRIFILMLLLVSFSMVAQTSTVKKLIKEQVVSQPLEYSFGKIFSFINLDYFMTLKQTNRVHSVTRGKGIKVTIKNYQPDVKFSVVPINAIGVEKSLFEFNLLFPGTYKLIAKKGTKLAKLTVSKNTTVDYYQLVKATGFKSDLKFGRLQVVSTPSGAKIEIDNHHAPYHSGMQLPEGKYRFSVSKNGYQTITKRVSIVKDKISKIEVSLKRLNVTKNPKPKTTPSAKPQPQAKSKLTPGQDTSQKAPSGAISRGTKAGANANSVERIRVIGRRIIQDVRFDFKLKTRLRDRVVLILTNDHDEPIRIKKRTKGKEFMIEAQLRPGKYNAKLKTKKHGYFELGDIQIKTNSSNNINYFLTLN